MDPFNNNINDEKNECSTSISSDCESYISEWDVEMENECPSCNDSDRCDSDCDAPCCAASKCDCIVCTVERLHEQ